MQDSSKSLIATAFGHFINYGLTNIFPIIYPLLLRDYSFTTTSIGIIAASLNIFAIIASPFIGRRSDARRNFVSLIIFGIVILAISTAGFSFAMIYFTGFELFFILIFFASMNGFGSSFYHPIGAAILSEQWGSKNRGRALGINGSMGSLGILVVPIIAVALIGKFGTVSIAVLGGTGLIVAWLIYMLMRGVRFYPASSAPTAPLREVGPVPSQFLSSSPLAVSKSISLGVILPTIMALTIYSFIRSVFTSSISQFLPAYLTTVNRIPYNYVGLAVAVVPGMGIISQPLLGQLADRFGRRLVLGISSVAASVTMIFFLYSSNIILSEVLLGMSGMFQYTAFPLTLALASEISPKGANTLSNSIVWGFGGVAGATFGSLLTEYYRNLLFWAL
ncbi:MAG: MFS transporter [Rhabdochlamydiaceae bacterium]